MYAKRVPSSLTPERQRAAVSMVRAGRSFHQVAYELSVSEHVVSELYTRDLERRARELLASLSARIDEIDADLRGTARRRAA